MLDNQQSGSSLKDAVAKMQSNREANKPEPVLDESTGGTDEVLEPQHDEVESEVLEAEHEVVEEEVGDIEENRAPEKFSVKVNGEELEVSLDELQAGYMMHSDYTKKTMTHAEEAKQLEASKAAFDQERISKLEELAAFIEQKEESVDWESLRDTDPGEYLKQKELQDARKSKLETEQRELLAKQQEQAQANLAQEVTALKEAMGPTWSTEKAKADFDSAEKYLSTIGVTSDEFSRMQDHRMLQIVFDGMKYREILARGNKVTGEIKSAPKSVKPGQRRADRSVTEVDKARNNLVNSDKRTEMDAAVALLKSKRGK